MQNWASDDESDRSCPCRSILSGVSVAIVFAQGITSVLSNNYRAANLYGSINLIYSLIGIAGMTFVQCKHHLGYPKNPRSCFNKATLCVLSISVIASTALLILTAAETPSSQNREKMV